MPNEPAPATQERCNWLHMSVSGNNSHTGQCTLPLNHEGAHNCEVCGQPFESAAQLQQEEPPAPAAARSKVDQLFDVVTLTPSQLSSSASPNAEQCNWIHMGFQPNSHHGRCTLEMNHGGVHHCSICGGDFNSAAQLHEQTPQRPLKADDATPFTSLTPGNTFGNTLSEQKKRFVFNSTGNIMISTTVESNSELQKEVQDLFNEVAVFFAAMTSAITTTPIPGQGDQRYSIYDYEALNKIIGSSGMFVNVAKEDIHYSSSSFGVQFCRDLVEAVLGLPAGAGALNFASALISSMGSDSITFSKDTVRKDTKVAHIVFVCEYLLGMPIVSALVVSVDSKSASTVAQAGPCGKTTSQQVTLDMHKDIYMFVLPAYIRRFSGDLRSINSDPDYKALVEGLRGYLKPA